MTPYGVPVMDDKVIDYLTDKKKAEDSLSELRLAAYTIDPKNPQSQERAFQNFPQLKEYPDQAHMQNLSMQEALRTMLRDGTVGGPEDLSLLRAVLREDFRLPVFPVWDEVGILLDGKGADQDGIAAYLNNMQKWYSRGLFNPRKWNAVSNDAFTEFQNNLKVRIVRHLFPALRDPAVASDPWIIRTIIQNASAVDVSPTLFGSAVSNDPSTFFNRLSISSGNM